MSNFVDARTLPSGSTINADLVIIGGGPAGISVARAFAGKNTRVCLLESGGMAFDAEVQAMYAGDSTGIEYPVQNSRLRYFGGSSNHWGGFCRPLDAIDFEARDWIPYSGWPFSRDELMPYYPVAAQLVQVAPAKFEQPDYWAMHTGESLPTMVSGRLNLQFVQYSPPTRFGQRYADALAQAPNIEVYLHANVVNIAVTEAGQAVTHLTVRTLSGLTHTVRARKYLLATGGLENARLLLASDDVLVTGVGNQHDNVGRFFMEHPHLSGFCEIVTADLTRWPRIYRQRVKVEGREANVAFKPSASFLREQKLLNASFQVGVGGKYQAQEAKPYPKALRAQNHQLMLQAARPWMNSAPTNAADTGAATGAWLGVGCSCEQAPNPASRVHLTAQRDSLGLPQLALDWRLQEQDRRSVVQHMRTLALEFGALGIGRTILNIEDDGQWPEKISGGNHHMGTTRMGNDPRTSVVDRNCKVHGMQNLYIAGSSVFPTAGTANPTLTLIALALRLAEHLSHDV